MTDEDPAIATPLLPDDTRPQPTWSDVSRHLAEADTYWLATIRPDGAPHVIPVLAVWSDGGVHFAAGRTSRKAANLSRDARCTITTSTPGIDLVVQGRAARVSDDARLRNVAAAYATKYDWHVDVCDGAFYGEGAPTAGPPPYDVYEITPTTIFAFGTTESFGATRWRF
jgi:nitroimidazol reductase NimA-like FMN-containing flavoprotein (pyridoxamine 5'-phosphate oxidase superfamily)